MKKTMMGRVESSTAIIAILGGVCEKDWPRPARANGSVRMSFSVVEISGQAYMFQAVSTVTAVYAAIGGPESGSTIRRNIWPQCAPSILAASRISLGIEM